jgi:Fe-Mn family superoxide dismutase
MTHKLPDLPYDYSALEPHIDTRTMAVHHDKHHAAYVSNLNKALEGYPDLQEMEAVDLLMDLEAVPEEIRTAVRNNAGGHVNHSLFWLSMGPNHTSEPGGNLSAAINETFGSFDGFKEQYSKAGATLFGSGWAWLCVDSEGSLLIKALPNQDSPISLGLTPILGLDVWEHAYYLKYENRRADYIAAWWNVVDWAHVQAVYNTWQIAMGIDQAVHSVKEIWEGIGKGWQKLIGS